jgi:hypothetical protein
VQFIGLPSTTLYVIALVAWGALAFGTLHPRAEDALAWKARTLSSAACAKAPCRLASAVLVVFALTGSWR